MEETTKLLKKVGLTEYEAKVYLALINKHFDGATRLSKESKVPRTKIYSVLESLENKGWIRIYSGYPLLFRARHPMRIFEKMKEDYDIFLESISSKIDEELNNVTETYVITNYNIGLENLKNEVSKAKTVWISNATTELLKKLEDSFKEDAEVKVVLFPDEDRLEDGGIEYKEAMLKIVHLVKGKVSPSASIIVDEERIFTAFKDPTNDKYIISEMLNDDCTNCFREWYKLGWND
jgi:sugar-specific transcriptional regulator TrmB